MFDRIASNLVGFATYEEPKPEKKVRLRQGGFAKKVYDFIRAHPDCTCYTVYLLVGRVFYYDKTPTTLQHLERLGLITSTLKVVNDSEVHRGAPPIVKHYRVKE